MARQPNPIMEPYNELKEYKDALAKLAEAERVLMVAREVYQEALKRLNDKMLSE